MASDPLTTPANIIDIMYPVGCIYMTTSTDSPQSMLSRFGVTSTWEKIQGRFILGSSSTYSITGDKGGTGLGGEEKHALTLDEMPAHTHQYTKNKSGTCRSGWNGEDYQTGRNWETIDSGSTGGNVAHNNMPPYYVANIWRRTS